MDDELSRLADESTNSTKVPAPAVASREVPGLTIAAHPDPSRVGQRLAMVPLLSGREVELSRAAPGFAFLDGPPHPLADLWLSRKPWVFSPAAGGVRVERRGSGTTMEVDGEEVDTVEVGPERLRRGVVLLLAGRVVLVLHRIRLLPPPRVASFGLVGDSCGMLALRQQIERVGALDVPVLLRGATGTGKELIAKALHRSGRRHDRAFVAVNVAAVPPSLAASELFGATKGAFTGAERPRRGFFREADSGTLFLDEIGDTPPEVQVLLLRALERGEVQPVGSDRPVGVDVRLVAATDADLDAAVTDGRFRASLLHRLGGYQVRVPALVERREDVGRLLFHFLGEELEALGQSDLLLPPRDPESVWLPGPLAARLVRYDWPGNVRQLRNVARQLAITYHDRAEVGAEAVAELLGQGQDGTDSIPAAASASRPSRRRRPSEIDDQELLETLRQHRFNVRAVAAAFGISRTSLYARIDQCEGLRKAADLDRAEIEAALQKSNGDADAAAAVLEVSSLALKRRLRELTRH